MQMKARMLFWNLPSAMALPMKPVLHQMRPRRTRSFHHLPQMVMRP
jgi:hypothetical protein